MKLERISLQLRDGSVRAFDFHPGLTVIEAEPGGSGPLIGALTGSLATDGDGIHVEVALDDGAHLVAFRPYGAAHRVVDTDTAVDLSSSFRTVREVRDGQRASTCWRPGGRQDARLERRLERDLVVTADDLLPSDPTEQWLLRLARLEPQALLGAATEEVAAEEELRDVRRRRHGPRRSRPPPSASSKRLGPMPR